jgi:hypothetical protein
VKTALGQPGPPCRTSSTGLSRSSPRSWTLLDPTNLDERCSTIPFWGVDHECLGRPALARLAPGQPADRRGGDDAGRATENGADHGCSQGPQPCGRGHGRFVSNGAHVTPVLTRADLLRRPPMRYRYEVITLPSALVDAIYAGLWEIADVSAAAVSKTE